MQIEKEEVTEHYHNEVTAVVKVGTDGCWADRREDKWEGGGEGGRERPVYALALHSCAAAVAEATHGLTALKGGGGGAGGGSRSQPK